MKRICKINGCKTNSYTTKEVYSVRFHKFPLEDESLLEKWTNVIPSTENNIKYLKNCWICSNHFKKEDYEYNDRLKITKLKKNAVPSIFDEASSKSKVIQSTDDLLKSLDSIQIPDQVQYKNLSKYLVFFKINFVPPRVTSSLVIYQNLEYKLYKCDKEAPIYGKVGSCDEVSKLLRELKSPSPNYKLTDRLNHCVVLLQSIGIVDRKIQYIQDQLLLIKKTIEESEANGLCPFHCRSESKNDPKGLKIKSKSGGKELRVIDEIEKEKFPNNEEIRSSISPSLPQNLSKLSFDHNLKNQRIENYVKNQTEAITKGLSYKKKLPANNLKQKILAELNENSPISSIIREQSSALIQDSENKERQPANSNADENSLAYYSILEEEEATVNEKNEPERAINNSTQINSCSFYSVLDEFHQSTQNDETLKPINGSTSIQCQSPQPEAALKEKGKINNLLSPNSILEKSKISESLVTNIVESRLNIDVANEVSEETSIAQLNSDSHSIRKAQEICGESSPKNQSEEQQFKINELIPTNNSQSNEAVSSNKTNFEVGNRENEINQPLEQKNCSLNSQENNSTTPNKSNTKSDLIEPVDIGCQEKGPKETVLNEPLSLHSKSKELSSSNKEKPQSDSNEFNDILNQENEANKLESQHSVINNSLLSKAASTNKTKLYQIESDEHINQKNLIDKIVDKFINSDITVSKKTILQNKFQSKKEVSLKKTKSKRNSNKFSELEVQEPTQNSISVNKVVSSNKSKSNPDRMQSDELEKLEEKVSKELISFNTKKGNKKSNFHSKKSTSNSIILIDLVEQEEEEINRPFLQNSISNKSRETSSLDNNKPTSDLVESVLLGDQVQEKLVSQNLSLSKETISTTTDKSKPKLVDSVEPRAQEEKTSEVLYQTSKSSEVASGLDDNAELKVQEENINQLSISNNPSFNEEAPLELEHEIEDEVNQLLLQSHSPPVKTTLINSAERKKQQKKKICRKRNPISDHSKVIIKSNSCDKLQSNSVILEKSNGSGFNEPILLSSQSIETVLINSKSDLNESNKFERQNDPISLSAKKSKPKATAKRKSKKVDSDLEKISKLEKEINEPQPESVNLVHGTQSDILSEKTRRSSRIQQNIVQSIYKSKTPLNNQAKENESIQMENESKNNKLSKPNKRKIDFEVSNEEPQIKISNYFSLAFDDFANKEINEKSIDSNSKTKHDEDNLVVEEDSNKLVQVHVNSSSKSEKGEPEQMVQSQPKKRNFFTKCSTFTEEKESKSQSDFLVPPFLKGVCYLKTNKRTKF